MTYSHIRTQAVGNGRRNRLMYFNRFPGSYVGLGDAWKNEAWHLYAIGFVWQKAKSGRSMIIYDVDPILQSKTAAENKSWNDRISPTQQGFV